MARSGAGGGQGGGDGDDRLTSAPEPFVYEPSVMGNSFPWQSSAETDAQSGSISYLRDLKRFNGGRIHARCRFRVRGGDCVSPE